MSEEVTRTDEEKAQMYSAMLGSVSVITNALDSSNDFCSDMTAQEVKDRVMRSCGYLEHGKALTDWGSEDFTTIDSAIAAAKAYTP
jgi:protein-arginine kinase